MSALLFSRKESGIVMAKKMSDWYYSIPKDVRRHLRIVLQGMTQRCYNKRMHSYPDYGGRGIRVCPEWYDAELNLIRTEPFMKWALQNGYAVGLQIDRIDNYGNYEPANCRFVTPIENGRNKRNCKPITYKGETLCLSEWAERLGLPKYILKERIKRGLPLDKVFEAKVYSKDMVVKYRGEKIMLSELARKSGIGRRLIRDRLKSGWSVKDAIEKKPLMGNSHSITYRGETNNKKYFANKYGIRPTRFCELIRAGMSIDEIVKRYGKC